MIAALDAERTRSRTAQPSAGDDFESPPKKKMETHSDSVSREVPSAS